MGAGRSAQSTMFEVWFATRLRELGQPRATGLLRRKMVYDGGAIIQALADTVRVALALGAKFPELAWRVAGADYGYIDAALKDRFLSLGVAPNVAEAAISEPKWKLFLAEFWVDPGRSIDSESSEFAEIWDEATRAIPQLALAWALADPAGALSALATPDEAVEDSSEVAAFTIMAERVGRRWLAEGNARYSDLV